MSEHRYKPTALLLVILIVPSLAIILLGWNDFKREHEKRFSETEERTKIEVRQELLQTLERIKLEVISGAAADSAPTLVAVAENDRLELPWDADPNAVRFRVASISVFC